MFYRACANTFANRSACWAPQLAVVTEKPLKYANERARERAHAMFKGNWFKSFWRTASGKKCVKNRNDCMWTSMNRIKQTQIIHMTTDWIMLNTSSSRCDRVTALQFQLKKLRLVSHSRLILFLGVCLSARLCRGGWCRKCITATTISNQSRQIIAHHEYLLHFTCSGICLLVFFVRLPLPRNLQRAPRPDMRANEKQLQFSNVIKKMWVEHEKKLYCVIWRGFFLHSLHLRVCRLPILCSLNKSCAWHPSMPSSHVTIYIVWQSKMYLVRMLVSVKWHQQQFFCCHSIFWLSIWHRLHPPPFRQDFLRIGLHGSSTELRSGDGYRHVVANVI